MLVWGVAYYKKAEQRGLFAPISKSVYFPLNKKTVMHNVCLPLLQ